MRTERISVGSLYDFVSTVRDTDGGYTVALGEGPIGYRLLQYNVRRNGTVSTVRDMVSIAHIVLSIDFISTLYRGVIQKRGKR